MRGYGTLQTMTALEVLIDEAAAALPLNPIEFRRRNALKQNGRTMMGNRYIVSVRTPEILDKLECIRSGGSARRKKPGCSPAASWRYRRRLRRQGLRQRRRLFASDGSSLARTARS